MRLIEQKRATRWIASVAAVGLLLVACTGDSEGGSVEPFDITTAVLSAPRTAPLGDARLLPSIPVGTRHTRWVEINRQQVCVRSMTPGEADAVCSVFEIPVFDATVTWSASGSELLFHEDVFQFIREPDIWALDIWEGGLANLTDDASTRVNDDLALIDTSPFTSDDGLVHYFQLNDDKTTLWTLDADGAARQIPLELDGVAATQGVHRVGADQFLIPVTFVGQIDASLMLLDLAGPTIRQVAVPGIDVPVVVTSGQGAAIVADRSLLVVQRSPYVYVRPDLAAVEPADIAVRINLDPDHKPDTNADIVPLPARPSFAMSPDGASFVVAHKVSPADEPELLGFSWTATESLSDPIVVAPAGFAPGINSSPTLQDMVWTDDNQLLMLTKDEALVFELTPGP